VGASWPARLIDSLWETGGMLLNMLKAKLHSGRVTQCDLYYEGSVSLDQDLMDAAGILANERVEIWNVTNGARIATYALEAPRGSRTIGINGAAARQFALADIVIIAAFAHLDADEARQHAPNVVLLDERNEIKRPS